MVGVEVGDRRNINLAYLPDFLDNLPNVVMGGVKERLIELRLNGSDGSRYSVKTVRREEDGTIKIRRYNTSYSGELGLVLEHEVNGSFYEEMLKEAGL